MRTMEKSEDLVMELCEGNKGLKQKLADSIALLKKTEHMALELDPRGFHLAFSGGKDSVALYQVAKMAGVKFFAEMEVTTIDPPELMRFIRDKYPDVKMNRPELNFYNLIKKKKCLPLRKQRYCCHVLKEQAGAGTVTLIGIRRAESRNRSKRNEVEISNYKFTGSLDQFNRSQEVSFQCISGKDKLLISPIIEWSDNDVWEFIKGNGFDYCNLYDEGSKRIGCVFCPMASIREKRRDEIKYPKMVKKIKESIQYLIDEYDYFQNQNISTNTITADQIFDWWITNKSSKEYFGKLNQQEMEFDDDTNTNKE